MTTTSRRERVKLNASTGNEEAPPPGKRAPNPALKQNKAAGAKSAESTASVKTSQSALENEKPRKPVRQAKVASEPAKAAKAGAADKAVKTVKIIKADKADKAGTAGNIATASKKTKLRRDSYSIPESEHKHIAVLKKRCIDQGKPIKKSYLLRAGLQVLTLMDDHELLAAIARVK